ncbi:GNAT family N-acetyltransferase [uncultured Clostridium sp.]|uniref:GNAT family N-acetyltransferase n=1 Tax=uncultured Clostridium sp. TaxID=59620 RepID=UPI00280B2D32|nr:GNAT family N-acetyltransferase [uncultured Clostridium sp.]
MAQINIREIKISDYNDIYLLNQELGYLFSIEKVKDRISYIRENTKDVILVAEKDNEVIGYIHGSSYETLYFNSLINILGFVVKKDFRNLGVGNLLINSLENWTKENEYMGIRLVSGYERTDAHRFYEKHGYINKKDQKNFIKPIYK